MSESKQSNSYSLTVSWKYYFFAYLLAVITIPLLVGLIGLYFIRRKHKSIRYNITNTQITTVNSEYQQNIDLVDIQSIEMKKSRLHRQLGIGSLVIHSSSSDMVLKGLKQPREIKTILEQAVQTLQNQSEKTKRRKPAAARQEPGKMERLNYLTGLWQQGLLSDEDYEKERTHFEDKKNT